ncbi:uncharacterized protein PHACADRAFT_91316 [Phanerochaete carnosa HHB-10118-sp]|uniref:Uncharacterized protein n=1 Tax=Phanerochaete carnosa (strain HHB-10118-sp) TaxID=650164 RepID=K5WBY4_PHACS|nr:uncharacterized protein PHACADRAFT_91316 [Phanerochaete carnosa HHB-10118-sp]EKM56494.1 hypothetical protein PHACADRAFT_91316 [Phanerochaete carnosa HHB-10118-sp]
MSGVPGELWNANEASQLQTDASLPSRPPEPATHDAMATAVADSLSEKPLHDYIRQLSRAVVAYQNFEKRESEMRRNQHLLHSRDTSKVPAVLLDAVKKRLEANETDIAESSREFLRVARRVQLPPQLEKALSQSDQSDMHTHILDAVSDLKAHVAEVKARLDSAHPNVVCGSRSTEEEEEGEISEHRSDVPMDVVEGREEHHGRAVPPEKDAEEFKRKVIQRLKTLAEDLAKVGSQLYQERNDDQDKANAYIENKVKELNLQSSRAEESSAQSQGRLEQLETSLTAASEEIRALREDAAAVRARAEAAESESDLLRQENAIIQENNGYLEKQLREVSVTAFALRMMIHTASTMQEEIQDLSTAVALLATKQQAPPPDPKRIAEAILPYAREAIREEVATRIERAVEEIQQTLQNERQDAVNCIMPKLNLTIECGEILTRAMRMKGVNDESV